MIECVNIVNGKTENPDDTLYPHTLLSFDDFLLISILKSPIIKMSRFMVIVYVIEAMSNIFTTSFNISL